MGDQPKPKRIFPLHLAPIDAFFIEDDEAKYPTTFSSLLTFSGKLDRALFRQSLHAARERHPLLSAFIRPAKRNIPCWVSAGDTEPLFDWAPEGTPIELPNGEPIDLANEVGMRVWVREGEQRTDVTIQFHHAACDGTGAYRFLGDWFALYDALVHGTTAELHELDPSQLKERARKMGDLYYNGSTWQINKNSFIQAGKLYGRKACELQSPSRKKPVDNPLQPFPGVLTSVFSRAEHQQLRAAAGDFNITFNDLLLCELFRAMADWTQKHGSHKGLLVTMMPTDMRSADEYSMPAANMVSCTFLRMTRKTCNDPATLREKVRATTVDIKNRALGAQFVDLIMAGMNYPRAFKHIINWSHKRRMCTTILSNVGDPTRRFTAKVRRSKGKVQTGNATLESIGGTPPLRPGTHATLAIVTYGRELAINLRCDPYRFNTDDTRAFLEMYANCLREHLVPENL